MDTILKVIDGVTTDGLVKSIINSLNENQEKSKGWLVEKSKKYFDFYDNPSIVVAAGWFGHLANKLRKYTKGEIVTFDKDPRCKKIGQRLYKDIIFTESFVEDYDIKRFNIAVCTSCEHFEQKVLDNFLQRCKGKLVILQSNNYFSREGNLNEHINCSNSLEEFEKSLKLEKILYKGTLKLDKFDRYMVIGTK